MFVIQLRYSVLSRVYRILAPKASVVVVVLRPLSALVRLSIYVRLKVMLPGVLARWAWKQDRVVLLVKLQRCSSFLTCLVRTCGVNTLARSVVIVLSSGTLWMNWIQVLIVKCAVGTMFMLSVIQLGLSLIVCVSVS